MNTLRAENRQGWRVTFLQQICLVVSNMALLFSTIIWYIILPIDELICFKMVKSPPTRNHGHGWFGGTPMAKKTCHFPHFQTPKFAVLRIPRTREKSNGVKSRGKHRSIQLYNSYISINKQVTIRDINGVKLLKSVIILNLLTTFLNFSSISLIRNPHHFFERCYQRSCREMEAPAPTRSDPPELWRQTTGM